MATSSMSLFKLAAFASRFRLLPATNRCVYLTFKHSQISRRFSSVGEESKSPKYESAQDLQLSDKCVKQLHKIFADDKDGFLRVSVEGGGCSGFKYTFDVDSDITEDDRIIERDGAKVVIDEVSLEYLKGSTVDYHEELIRSAFRVSLNPNAEKGCSCGSSFTFKL
ncbi:Iron-sulfur cluster assembly 2, mitochondrial [Desmophyllum pertusum]|uniref:Iron-sulfur cluster assembly 2 homolog, mitochondrial n=1 Tax=Desmophyllum pertusum TaxID=174260 RepID=A0A9W9ZZY0_9CNID|nr:Iron-sulfur cluster assembly 2, mitochondrial [Desmophyllum pertusum]